MAPAWALLTKEPNPTGYHGGQWHNQNWRKDKVLPQNPTHQQQCVVAKSHLQEESLRGQEESEANNASMRGMTNTLKAGVGSAECNSLRTNSCYPNNQPKHQMQGVTDQENHALHGVMGSRKLKVNFQAVTRESSTISEKEGVLHPPNSKRMLEGFPKLLKGLANSQNPNP